MSEDVSVLVYEEGGEGGFITEWMTKYWHERKTRGKRFGSVKVMLITPRTWCVLGRKERMQLHPKQEIMWTLQGAKKGRN